MDMGAPVFVKAGTLFVDDAHQPDMVVGEWDHARGACRLLLWLPFVGR